MDSFKMHASYGLRNIARFTGRDTKQQFLPYLGFCFVTLAILSQIVVFAFLRESFMPGSAPESFDFGAIVRRNALMGAVMGAVIMVLMAAAVTRRLRDTGRSVLWGLLPVPFLLVALYSMSQIAADNTSFELGFFAISFGVTVLYLAALAVLLWLLTRPSHYPAPTGAPVHR